MYFIDEIEDLADYLKRGQVLLSSTKDTWCLLMTEESFESNRSRVPFINEANPPILQVPDLQTLKLLLPDLHPRVETLLIYHNRPLAFNAGSKHHASTELVANQVGFVQLSSDPLVKALCQSMKQPIVSIDVLDSKGEHPISLSQIERSWFDAIDYVVRYRKDMSVTGEPCVIAQYNYKGELDFIRE